MDISIAPVKHFLDSVDSVLNSNTFMVEFEFTGSNLEKSVGDFLQSDDFIEQLTQQDRQRDWYNLHHFDTKENCYKVKSGNILEPITSLAIEVPACGKREYLVAMLTGDTSIGNFFSFYHQEIKREKAEIIVDNLTSYLSLYSGNWDLFTIKPNFLKCTSRTYAKGENIRYFEGDYGNDTATIIRYQNKGYLILTNGID